MSKKADFSNVNPLSVKGLQLFTEELALTYAQLHQESRKRGLTPLPFNSDPAAAVANLRKMLTAIEKHDAKK
jgi:hypothetical protein